MRTGALSAAFALLVSACHDPGPYGHSPHYVELDSEAVAAAGARDYDPVMVERAPGQWRGAKVALFGVVQSRQPGPGGQARLELGVRRLDPRNLCMSDTDDGSCRVTVSDKDFGEVVVLVSLRGDDDVGPKSVQARSLLRVVGTVGQEVSPGGGWPVVHAAWYRHWPAFYYVTRASAGDMRQ